MQQHDAEPLDVSHSHDDGGFDVVIPSFKSDALLWVLVALSAGYLGYLVWSELRGSRKRQTALVIAVAPTDVKNEPESSPVNEPGEDL